MNSGVNSRSESVSLLKSSAEGGVAGDESGLITLVDSWVGSNCRSGLAVVSLVAADLDGAGSVSEERCMENKLKWQHNFCYN